MIRGTLRWGYDRAWDKWPVMLAPLVRKFRRRNGYWPNLVRPTTFNEKVLARMLFDRRSLLPALAGKLEGRAWIGARLGSAAPLVPLLGVVRRAAEVRALALPAAFVMKGNHGSDMVHIQRADEPVDLGQLEALAARFLANDYGKYGREWVYKGVERAVVFERLLLSREGAIPADLKLYCYDGVVRVIDCLTLQTEPKRLDTFTPDWTHMPGPGRFPNAAVVPGRPEHLDVIVALAERLSAGIDFVRVDAYDTPEGAWIGEMTTTPNAGTQWFPSWEVDGWYGAPWRLRLR